MVSDDDASSNDNEVNKIGHKAMKERLELLGFPRWIPGMTPVGTK